MWVELLIQSQGCREAVCDHTICRRRGLKVDLANYGSIWSFSRANDITERVVRDYAQCIGKRDEPQCLVEKSCPTNVGSLGIGNIGVLAIPVASDLTGIATSIDTFQEQPGAPNGARLIGKGSPAHVPPKDCEPSATKPLVFFGAP